jgi:CMP-N-acetylneuraminic acid synthetase
MEVEGGSTRLPRKNILPLGGKSLLAWAGQALKGSGICDRIVVSTDDYEIADHADENGIDVPFIRPTELSYDPAGVADVALHCIEALENHGERYDTIVITLPTCPFRTSQDLQKAYKKFLDRKAKFLLSVSAYDHTHFAAMKLENDIVSAFFPKYFGLKSQEMPLAFRPNGALHILDVLAFKSTRNYFTQPLYAYEMQWPKGIDIDTQDDLAIAEALLQAGYV